MGEDNRLIGRLVAGAGGGALVVSVFLTWYSLSLADVVHAAASQLPAQLSGSISDALAGSGGLTLRWSGWHAVHAIRFALLIVGIVVLLSSIAPSTTPGNRKALLVLAGGVLASVLVAYRINSPPGALDISVGPVQLPSPAGTGGALSRLLQVHPGAWVALVGGALVTLGGWAQLGRGRTVAAVPMTTFPTPSASKAPPGY
jgi:hypothetical protein